MIMEFARILWKKAHAITKVPGMYRLFLSATNLMYPDGKIVTINKGPLSGCRWQRFQCHQAWMAMGSYEPHVAKLIGEILRPGDVFYDVGANAGYFTLLGASRVGGGRVVAFEPVPFNVQVIQRQLNWPLTRMRTFAGLSLLRSLTGRGRHVW